MPARPVIAALLLGVSTLPVSAAGPNVASQVPGVQVLRLDHLNPAPAAGPDRAACEHLLVAEPATAAGQRLAQLGWGVTSEQTLGGWTAVSFVSGYSAATSGTCELIDGNVGLFAGDHLEIVVYATDEPAVMIGQIDRFGTAGLRIYSGDLLPQPVADLQALGADGLIVTPPALSEPVCNGAAQVPYIYGLPIDMARQMLAQAGWQPAPPETVEEFGIAPDLARAGVPEVEACAGTGFGFCGFTYEGPAGRLSVTTVGEIAADGSLPPVVGYAASCATAP